MRGHSYINNTMHLLTLRQLSNLSKQTTLSCRSDIFRRDSGTQRTVRDAPARGRNKQPTLRKPGALGPPCPPMPARATFQSRSTSSVFLTPGRLKMRCDQWPRHRNNLNVHRQMNGKRGGTYIQWDTTQPFTRVERGHL